MKKSFSKKSMDKSQIKCGKKYNLWCQEIEIYN